MNKTIVFTNGCFDLLHKGHTDLLFRASQYGDILIVGINSDKSVKKIKGEERPVEDQNARKKKLLDLNSYFSASGIITFKNSIELQETFKFIPLEKILIETDSPYLAPVPNRGKKNEPSFIRFTAEKLASIKEIKTEQLVETTSLNFNYLFR